MPFNIHNLKMISFWIAVAVASFLYGINGQAFPIWLSNYWDGLVFMIYNGQSDYVCGDGDWDNRECQVVCRQLGYGGGYRTRHYVGGTIYNYKFSCNGYEQSLEHCYYYRTYCTSYVGGCTCNTPAYAQCNPMIYGYQGNKVSLSCNIAYYYISSVQKITWYKDTDNVIVQHDVANRNYTFNDTSIEVNKYVYDPSDYTLTITKLSTDDVSCYRCLLIYNYWYTRNSYTRLSLIVPPREVYPPTVIYNSRKEHWITCEVPNVNPGRGSITFTINIDGERHDNLTSTDADIMEVYSNANDTYSVIFTKKASFAKKDNGKNVTCGINWMNDTYLTSSETSLNLTFYATSLTIIKEPEDPVLEGQTINIVCETDEHTTDQYSSIIQWNRYRPYPYYYYGCCNYQLDYATESNSTTEVDGLYNAKKTQSTLTINVSRKHHKQQYICSMINSYIYQIFVLNVTFAANNATLYPSTSDEMPIREYTWLTLSCHADAYPEPTLSIWTEHKSELISQRTSSTNLATGIYMTRKYNDMDIFCEAIGDSPGTYSVQTEVLKYNVTFQASGVNITNEPNGYVIQGTTVSITCESDEGNPTPNLFWSKHNYYNSYYYYPDGLSEIASTTEEDGDYNSKRSISTLQIHVSRSHHNRRYYCRLHGTSLYSSVTLNVAYSPTVSVSTYPWNKNEVNESESLQLNCNAYSGNPSLYTFKWNMVYSRYNNSATPNEYPLSTSSSLQLSNVGMQAAGTYMCTATNLGGSGNDTIDIFVTYSPIDVSRPSQTVAFSGLNEEIKLNCSVMSYPEIDKTNVTIRHNNEYITQGYTVTKSKMNIDEFDIEVLIKNVVPASYGVYAVLIDNNVGLLDLKMELRERGPPEAPTNAQSVQITAHTATISWICGRSGGFKQIFQVYYKPSPNAAYKITPDIQDFGVGNKGIYTLSGLMENTLYYVKIVSINDNKNGGNTAESAQFTVLTLGVPTLKKLQDIKISGNQVTITWDKVQGFHTKKVIEMCTRDKQKCQIVEEVYDVAKTTITIHAEDPSNHIFIVKLYQYQDMVKSYELSSWSDTVNGSNNIGMIVGVVCAVVIVVSAVTLVILVCIKCRHNCQRKPKNRTVSTKILTEDIYDNIGKDGETFHKTGSKQSDTELQTYTGLVFDTQKRILPKLPSDTILLSDIKLSNVIAQGPFSILKKGELKKKNVNIRDVAVKLPKDRHSITELQTFCYQMNVFENLPEHANIINVIYFNADVMKGDVLFLSKYYEHQDLRKYLHSLEKSEYYNTDNEKIKQLQAVIDDVVKGMSFLQAQKPEILHSELSAAHVLVDSDHTCKITGFGFTKDIIAKEKEEIKQEAVRLVQWKAPECITYPDMHTQESDIWSFGVLLYEIYSQGSMPYKGKTDDEIIQYVKEGSILPSPYNCPDPIYDLMIQCWNKNPKERPSFENIRSQLENMYELEPYSNSMVYMDIV